MRHRMDAFHGEHAVDSFGESLFSRVAERFDAPESGKGRSIRTEKRFLVNRMTSVRWLHEETKAASNGICGFVESGNQRFHELEIVRQISP